MPELDLIESTVASQAVIQAIQQAPLPGLADGPRCPDTVVAVQELINGGIDQCSAAALWLLAGELDRSHTISQELGNADGFFWHGIMHRREGDFWNSKYWFRRVGKHPVHRQLAAKIASSRDLFAGSRLPVDELCHEAKLPAALVDLVEKSLADQSEWVSDLERICWWEWQLLFAHGCS